MRRNHMTSKRLLVAFAFAGLAVAPVSLAAQQAQQTHTVKKGDTLWDLAQTYLGDPFRWPEIYRRNTATVQDPNLIYPDQVLIISGDVAATPGTPPDDAVPADTSAAARLAGDTTRQAGDQPVYVQRPMTIFNPDRFRVVRGTRESLLLRTRDAAVRAGDYLRSPFVTVAGGMSGAGKVDATTSSDAVKITLSERPVQVYDRVHVQLPAGVDGARDLRLMTFRDGPLLAGQGRVIVPTGIIKLVSAGSAGRAEAVLVSKFEDVYTGQGVMVMDTLPSKPGVFPTRVEFGGRTKLVWIYQDPVLPSIGHHLIFAAAGAEGLSAGDQITVQRDMGVDAKGVPLPPEDIAVAQVTRVTPQGTSAIIIGVTDAGLLTGQSARVTAKMP